jgi:hypothetical protein
MYNISIESVVQPGDDAIYGEYNLNFGAKIGITLNYAIENLCEKTGNEYVHTTWMHSHPGLGLFLSSQDLSVQSQLAHSSHPKRLLAIVLDSNTPDLQMAFFAPKQTGAMNNDQDIKQTLSLETLYQWAKSLPTTIEKTPDYYGIDILHRTSIINKVLFKGPAIIEMDMAIMPDSIGLQGYLYGKIQNKEVFIDDFDTLVKETDKPISCFLVISHFSNQDVSTWLNDPEVIRFDFSIIYCIEDEKIYLFTKDEQQEQLQEQKARKTFASLKEMKEWTRRKR